MSRPTLLTVQPNYDNWLLPRGASVSVRLFTKRHPRKPEITFVEGLAHIPYGAFEHTADVGKCVLQERLFAHVVDGNLTVPFVPSEETVVSCLHPFLHAFQKHRLACAKRSYEQFVAQYAGSKRRLYDMALRRMKDGNWVLRPKRWAYIRAFIKHEKMVLWPVKRFVPRLIQPRAPEFNIVVGSYLQPMEHRIFKVIQKMFATDTPVVAKGMDCHKLGQIIHSKYAKFKNCQVIGFDLSRFDQHISEPVLRFEHQFYYSCLRNKTDIKILRSFLNCQLHNHGTLSTNGGNYTYSIKGSRASGDINTSLGNCIIMCALIKTYADSIHQPVGTYDVIDNGDDSAVFTTPEWAVEWDGFTPYCASLGFILKVEPTVSDLERFSFCQMFPLNVRTSEWIMVRNYPTVTSKDVYTTKKFPTHQKRLNYIADIGVAGLSLAPGVPILQEFYAMMAQASETPEGLEGEYCGLNHWRLGLLPKYLPVSEEARLSFWKATGVAPQTQMAIESQYKRGAPDFKSMKYTSTSYVNKTLCWCPAWGCWDN